MKYIKNIASFTNGVNTSQLLKELIDAGVLAKSIIKQSTHLIILANNEDQDTIIDIAIADHIPVIPTTLEIIEKTLYQGDYMTIRETMRTSISSFSELTQNEKEIAAKYCLSDDTSLVMFYMGSGLDQTQAVNKHKVRRAEDINNAALSCKLRAESPVVKYIAIKYLSIADASAFLDSIRNFLEDYKTVAHLGLAYGQNRDGIMDYIEATNAYVDIGLTLYTFNTPYTYIQCRDELKNYLVYGISPTEFDEFKA